MCIRDRNEYYSALGLGEPTGIEVGESTGRQAVNESGQDQAPWACLLYTSPHIPQVLPW